PRNTAGSSRNVRPETRSAPVRAAMTRAGGGALAYAFASTSSIWTITASTSAYSSSRDHDDQVDYVMVGALLLGRCRQVLAVGRIGRVLQVGPRRLPAALVFRALGLGALTVSALS